MPDNARQQAAACIAEYFATRTQGPWAVSTGHALKRVREVLPQSPVTDEELIRMIADHAIMRGFNVTFDAADDQRR